MTDSHLSNTIRMLKLGANRRALADAISCEALTDYFDSEADYEDYLPRVYWDLYSEALKRGIVA